MAEAEIDRLWRAFKAEPASPAFHDLVRVLLAAGRHGDAVRVCEMGLSHHGSDARAYLALGTALKGVGRWADAQAALVRAVKLDSGDPACVRALGEILLEQGEARRARELFAHALRRAPGDITLRELFERASSAAGLPAIPDAIHAADRATPLPPTRTRRADQSREDTYEILEVSDAAPTPSAGRSTDVRPMPAALEVALRAELTLSSLPVPGPSGSPARRTPLPPTRSTPLPPTRRTPLPPARGGPLAPPPRAPAPPPPAPAPLLTVEATGALRETTDEISARDLIEDSGSFGVLVDPAPQRVMPAGHFPEPRRTAVARPPRRLGRLFAVVAIVIGLGGGAGTVGGWWWMRDQRLQRSQRASRQAERALERGDAEGYATALRLSDQALRAQPDNVAFRDRAALARSLALLEAGIGKRAAAESRLRGLRETADAVAARAAVRIATGEWAMADALLGKAPGGAEGPRLPYLRGLVAARRGDANARELLEAVTKRWARHVPTRIALAELDLVEGSAERALGEAERARQAQSSSLRPVIVSVVAQAHTGDPGAALGLADDLAPRAAKGSACDRSLLSAARSEALHRAGRVADGRAAAESPDVGRCADPMALVLWARAASAAGAHALALPVLERVRALAPDAVAYRITDAEVRIQAGRAAEAEQLLVGIERPGPEVDLLRARAAIAQGDDRRAIPILERVAGQTPDRLEPRLLLLRARVRTGEATAAEELRALERTKPDDPGVQLAVAEAALVARDPAGAIERLQRVVAHAPSAEAYNRLGMALRLAARFGEAVDAFREAFGRSPDDAASLEAAATLELARGRLDEAQAIATQLGAAPGGAESAQLLSAEVDLARGDGAAALARLDALPRTVSPPRRVTLLRARALARQGQIERAMLVLEPLLADPRDAESRALRGEIRRARPADRVGAAEDFERALVTDPGLPEALLGRLEIALDRDERSMVASLLERCVQALQARLRPPAAHARLLVARARDALAGGPRVRAGAKELLVMATETAPQHAESWFWLGKVLGAGNADGRAALQRSLDLQSSGVLADEARRLLR